MFGQGLGMYDIATVSIFRKKKEYNMKTLPKIAAIALV